MSNVTECHSQKLIMSWQSLDNLVNSSSRLLRLCGEIVKEFFSQFQKTRRSWYNCVCWQVKCQPLSRCKQRIKQITTIPRSFWTHIQIIQNYKWIRKNTYIVVFPPLSCLVRTYRCHVFPFLQKDRGCRAFRHFVTFLTLKIPDLGLP